MNLLSDLLFRGIQKILSSSETWYWRHALRRTCVKIGSDITVHGKIFLWNPHMSLGSKINVYSGAVFWGPGEIIIGDEVEIGFNSIIYSSKQVIIGNKVSIAAHCYIIDSNHGIKRELPIQDQVAVTKGPVIIEDDIWLGAGVKILSGVHIGKGAVIGAQSLVNNDIPAYAIAVGIPAKVVGYRK